MSDDWGWYFTSAERRTSILRDQLEAANAAAVAQTSRLSSQLRTLQGSLETRLNALSAAFDAYVELGDIREQLAGFPDTTVIRRDVAVAIDALAQGRRAQRVDDRGETTYWLPSAANAVIGIVEGRPDSEAEQAAHELSPQAELFIVAACGALGHGPAVAERLPSLLICDAALNEDQVALWDAAVAGRFGAVLPAIREVWSTQLAQLLADLSAWRQWCSTQARTRDPETLVAWIAELVGVAGIATRPSRGSQPAPANRIGSTGSLPAAETRPTGALPASEAALRAVVGRLVAQGTDQEAPLLQRARTLRERIENPARAGDSDAEPTRVPIADVVRRSLLVVEPGTSEERELLAWSGLALRSIAEQAVEELSRLEPVRERIHTPDGDVFVAADGPVPGQVDRVRAEIAARYPDRSPIPAVAGGATALFVVLAVSAIVLGSGWGYLAVLAAIVAAVVCVRAERARRARRIASRDAISRLDEQVAAAERTVTARLDAREITRGRVSSSLDLVRASVHERCPIEVAGRLDPAGQRAGQV